MTNPKLVIFDCDGVLVDTERATNANLAGMISGLGVPIDAHDCQKRFMGKTLEDVQKDVEALCGTRLAEDWPDQVRARDLERFKAGVDPIQGVHAVLDWLDSKGVPYCVGSSGRYAKMRVTLGNSGLLPRLDGRLFSAEDCAHGKPAPDVFLLAARTMGFPPEDCVVIEDSLPGLRAAQAAGMRAYAYCADPVIDQAAVRAAGGIVFDRMTDLPALLFPDAANT